MKKLFMRLPMGLRMVVIAAIYLVVLVGHIGIVYYYNSNVATVIDSKEVVVAVRDIPIHTVITEEDVVLKRVKLDNLVPDAYMNIQDVVGMESRVKIIGNDQLHESKLSEKIKDEGEIIIELPPDWIVSFPKSIRRHDKINIIPLEDESRNRDVISYNIDNPELLKKEEERKAKAALFLSEVKDKKLNGIKVVYFKDNTANDITDESPNVTTSNGETPRVTASNLGTRLEVAVTPEQWEIIQGLYEVKYKFIVGYQ